MGKFEISKRKNEEFQFNLKAGNGEVILTSEGYTTKNNCKKGIESVKKNSPYDERYERKVAANDKPYFNLKATNGEIIGTSQMYANEADRERGIESVKRTAHDAEIVDLTSTLEHHVSNEKEEYASIVSESDISSDKNEIANPVPLASTSPTLPSDHYDKDEHEPYLEEQPKKKSYGWLKLLLLLLALLLLLFFIWKACAGKDVTVREPVAVIEKTVVEKIEAPVAKVPVELTLPNGVKLNAFKGGIEDQMIAFLMSDEYKNATEDQLKNKWFNFDNIEFKFNSGTELKEGSDVQLKNVVEILKYFKDAKVKVGAYTDKVGSESVNMKMSQERANTIKTILSKDGLSKQITGAEGYGDKFAKYDKDAPDSQRALDRIMALRFVK